ncbi:MAG TPA: TetR/AcrR family transcriptional regulator [Actinomycetes bacterium]|nr:TetR/AcrR family transcriptional regulator [Actinomycetes bacterium]
MTTTGARASQRRGRPPAGTSAAHREVVLDAVVELLVERGYQGTTMAAVAERAGSSKETLYAWFGGKQGLFTALIRRQAEAANQAVAAALDDDGGTDPAATLTAFATNLLRLLLGERSVALNRAALAELGGGRAAGRAPAGELAAVLLAQGRHRTGPIVEAYLARLAEAGVLDVDDPAEAFQLLYGLVVRDLQIRVLLGEPPPAPEALAVQARTAVERFLALTAAPPN